MRMTTSGLNKPCAVEKLGSVSLSASTDWLMAGRALLLLECFLLLLLIGCFRGGRFAADVTAGELGKRYNVTALPSARWDVLCIRCFLPVLVGLTAKDLDLDDEEEAKAYASVVLEVNIAETITSRMRTAAAEQELCRRCTMIPPLLYYEVHT